MQTDGDTGGEVALVGSGQDLKTVPWTTIRGAVQASAAHGEERRSWMSQDHVRVREYVVREMRPESPLPRKRIAADLGLSEPRVEELVSDLEKRLFFLVTNDDGAVTWAFPVTTEPTPHRLLLNNGERLYAA